ncbi:MAG: phage major capsid protein [Gammaproteobacteria bacterium]|nr:phage major capsid protein [Gammaproteobacteria bacterium]
MASPNLTELVTTTLRSRKTDVADNVANANALLGWLSMRGRVKNATGGTTITEPLMYAENSTYQRYSGYEILDVSPSDVISSAEYDWKQASVNVIASGLETVIKNSGKEQVIDLLDARIENAMITMRNNVNIDAYSDGTSTNQLGGLQHLVAISPTTGTVGSINRANFAFWRNYTSGDIANLDTDYDTLEKEMRDAVTNLTRGSERPSAAFTDDDLFSLYWSGLINIQRIEGTQEGNLGFRSLKFADIPVFLENSHGGGSSVGIRDKTMYFINDKYIFFRPHPQRFFEPQDRKEPVNQDAIVVPLLFAGNMTMSNASLQGVIYT